MRNMIAHIEDQQEGVSSSSPAPEQQQTQSNEIPDGALDLSEDLDLLRKTLPLQEKSLSSIAVRNELARPSLEMFSNFIKSVKKWTKGGKFERLSEPDIQIVLKFTTGI